MLANSEYDEVTRSSPWSAMTISASVACCIYLTNPITWPIGDGFRFCILLVTADLLRVILSTYGPLTLEYIDIILSPYDFQLFFLWKELRIHLGNISSDIVYHCRETLYVQIMTQYIMSACNTIVVSKFQQTDNAFAFSQHLTCHISQWASYAVS